jgi:hypothetical protein
MVGFQDYQDDLPLLPRWLEAIINATNQGVTPTIQIATSIQLNLLSGSPRWYLKYLHQNARAHNTQLCHSHIILIQSCAHHFDVLDGELYHAGFCLIGSRCLLFPLPADHSVQGLFS